MVMKGKDNILRGVSVRTSNRNMERVVQHIYPPDLSCDEPQWKPNPEVQPFAYVLPETQQLQRRYGSSNKTLKRMKINLKQLKIPQLD